jgi:hypothetical protein
LLCQRLPLQPRSDPFRTKPKPLSPADKLLKAERRIG